MGIFSGSPTAQNLTKNLTQNLSRLTAGNYIKIKFKNYSKIKGSKDYEQDRKKPD